MMGPAFNSTRTKVIISIRKIHTTTTTSKEIRNSKIMINSSDKINHGYFTIENFVVFVVVVAMINVP